MNAFVFSTPKTKGTDPWYEKNDWLVRAAVARANKSMLQNANKEGK